MPAIMRALQPLCDHWSMLMKGSVNDNEGKFCSAGRLKFFYYAGDYFLCIF